MSFWEIEDIKEFEENEEILNLLKNGNIKNEETGSIFVPSLPKDDVISIEPIVTRRIHKFPIGDVLAIEDYIITVCSDNYIRFWLRPNHKSMKKQSSNPLPTSQQNETKNEEKK